MKTQGDHLFQKQTKTQGATTPRIVKADLGRTGQPF